MTPAPPTIVLGTGNAHKVAELTAILGPLLPGVEFLRSEGPSPVEYGKTFEANALIKARAAHELTGLPAIADDSGIVVDALGGAPGIHSARYAGTGDDGDNRRLLLERLGDATDRTARFVCAAVYVDEGVELVRRAEWEGVILPAERGEGGFGYDPLFVPDDADGRSAGELSADEKNAISHRGKAFRALAEAVPRP
ncbi:RdgB/HAM1 family non-canonical purine NTP pyrophosphatase [Amnibacterium setariae]|uniref:dITP/XTP pyrophosphatase n=1 Tax=Amnibacterium setariae TaxID=2306585 RepID=A0A3A1U6A0_9MICO|nr:RdgB/HAM1 family non-canonical purine NTP pyrophosphatase [Amnibacterium setariae]RIX30977.1 RdgB/HAM1 family non-canonical purine NTP pyrophosphatase [Amnibacterium setariae]